jgi:hypothetical protein
MGAASAALCRASLRYGAGTHHVAFFLTPTNTQRPTEERVPTVVDGYGLDKMMGIMWLIRITITI